MLNVATHSTIHVECATVKVELLVFKFIETSFLVFCDKLSVDLNLVTLFSGTDEVNSVDGESELVGAELELL